MMTLIEKLAEFPVKTVNVQGQQQAYREAGQGEYLVLLHGISSGSASWVNQLEVLSLVWADYTWGKNSNIIGGATNSTGYTSATSPNSDKWLYRINFNIGFTF